MTADAPGIPDRLKRVLRYMPAPVGVVTSYDPDTGAPVGLAMSALMPMSLDPPSMAIAVNRSGSSHAAMLRAGEFCINLLDPDHFAHITPFASAAGRETRFQGADWRQRERIWYIDDTAASIFCRTRDHLSFGTHDLLIGEVVAIEGSSAEDILAWADGRLCRVMPLSGAV